MLVDSVPLSIKLVLILVSAYNYSYRLRRGHPFSFRHLCDKYQSLYCVIKLEGCQPLCHLNVSCFSIRTWLESYRSFQNIKNFYFNKFVSLCGLFNFLLQLPLMNTSFKYQIYYYRDHLTWCQVLRWPTWRGIAKDCLKACTRLQGVKQSSAHLNLTHVL